MDTNDFAALTWGDFIDLYGPGLDQRDKERLAADAKRLLFWLERAGDSPCTQCAFWERCSAEHIACQTFYEYLDSGVIGTEERSPNKKFYNDIFTDDVGFSGDRHEKR